MATENLGDILVRQMNDMASRDNRNEGDYYEDEILHCGKCHEPKQAWIDWIPDAEGKRERKLVPCMCKCETEAWDAEKAKAERGKFKMRLDELRGAITNGYDCMPKSTFGDDSNPNNVYSKACRNYVARWQEMKANNMGILFYGSKGTGKTFYASCIANALTEKNVTTAFTTVANLMSVLSGRYKVEAIDAISRVQLIVLDDLDTERNTSYGMELLYTVIDTRYRSGKPTIITTNLEIENMKEETDLALSRVYDRVIEMCPIAMKINGESRRIAAAETRKKIAREILAGAMRE